MDSSVTLPGCGGLLKAAPEDFEVEELPAYLPSGEGEHLFLWIEKRGRTTPEVIDSLAQALGVPSAAIGHAGMKDRQAVTRQWISVPAKAEPRLSSWSDDAAKVLEAKRHQNKLKPGHLKGNRFRIRLREASHPENAAPIVRRLEERGVPNFFGEQRFGRRGDNWALGKRLLLGERMRVSRFQRKLYLSALQSELFNRGLSARLEEGTFDRALEGDVLKKTDSGGEFVCESPEVEQPRLDRFELSVAGPLFGPRMTPSRGAVAERERALLESVGLTPEAFERSDETQGARRPYRVRLEGAQVATEGSDVVLSFALPAGSYATVVLAQVMKGG